MRAYISGGARGSHVILACLAAADSLWPGFEERWSRVLSKHNLRWWRAADAMSMAGHPRAALVDPDLGWDRSRALAAVDELGGVIRDTHAEHFDACTLRSGVQIASCVVDMDAHSEAKSRNPRLPSAGAICANVCVAAVLGIDETPGVLHVDQGEGLVQEVAEAWSRERTSPNAEEIRIETVRQVRDAHLARGLQAADLLVWSTGDGVRRAAEEGGPRANIFGRLSHYYGLEDIERDYPLTKEAGPR